MTKQVLLIEDDEALRISLAQTLDLEGIDVIATGHFVQAKRTLRANFAGVILTDIRMPDKDGFDVLSLAQSVDPELPVVMLTGEGDVPMVIRAMKEGAYDFLEKPCDTTHLIGVLNRALAHRDLVLKNRRIEQKMLRSDPASVNFPGGSKASTLFRDELRSAAESGRHVLLIGEDGVGKKLAAHTIFSISEGRDAFVTARGPEIIPDQFTLPNKALDLSLKRLEKTDKTQMDAVYLSMDSLAHLRVLGSSTRELPAFAAASDCITIHVPNFKDRKADLPVMFEALLRQAVRSRDLEMPELPDELFDEIDARDWHGNLSELRNFANDFVSQQIAPSEKEAQTLADKMDGYERSVLEACLQRHKGKASRVASELGLPRKTLYDRLARYGLRPRDYQA